MLASIIMQNNKPIVFYSRKLNSAQQKYTTGEQELLSIVEMLKEFHNILLGQRIVIHTDHKNILYRKLSSDGIIRWRLLLEEYGPEKKYETTILCPISLSHLHNRPRCCS
jgi:hypothetical protein